MNKAELKAKAEALGVDVDGRWSAERIAQEIESASQPEIELSEPEVIELDDSEPKRNKDGFVIGQHIESEDLLKHLAMQRARAQNEKASND